MAAATLDAFLNSYRRSRRRRARGSRRRRSRSWRRRPVESATPSTRACSARPFAGAAAATNADGDVQKDLDVFADDIFLDAMRQRPGRALRVRGAGAAGAARPGRAAGHRHRPARRLLQHRHQCLDRHDLLASSRQLARRATTRPPLFCSRDERSSRAGFFIYGPQLALVLSLGSGTHVFVFSTRHGHLRAGLREPHHPAAHAGIRHQRRELPALGRGGPALCRRLPEGRDGPRERDFNMRWIASLVAEAHRILIRGGVFLYPGDQRKGYGQGRLRLVYEANPIAFLIEQAGGAATDTVEPHPRHRAREPAPAHAAGVRLGARSRRASPATTPTRARSASARRCSAIAACSGPDGDEPCPPSTPSSRSPARRAPAPPRSSASSSRSSGARRSRRPSSRATPSTATTARR